MNFQDFQKKKKKGAREVSKSFGALSSYFRMNFLPGEIFSIIVHPRVLHTHPGGFHLGTGENIQDKPLVFSYAQTNLVYGQGIKKENLFCLGESFHKVFIL